MGKKDHTGQNRAVDPVLLSGSTKDFEQIVGFGNQAGKYTSGGLYFEETREDLIKKFGSEKAVNEKLQEIMDGFEETLFPGLDKDQYCGVWVLHEDKGNIELNFLFAKEELRSGKSLTPYFHKADYSRVNAWKDIVNYENGFSNPGSPDKRRYFIPEFFQEYAPADFGKTESRRRDFKKDLVEELEIMAANDQFENRDDLTGYLENQRGLKVSRKIKTAISVINPQTDKPVRLKGELFEEKADYKKFSSEDYRKELMEKYENERLEKIQAQKEKYQKHMIYKKEELTKKYNKEVENGQIYEGINIEVYRRAPRVDEINEKGNKRTEGREQFVERREQENTRGTDFFEEEEGIDLETFESDCRKARRARESAFNRFFGEDGLFGKIVGEVSRRLALSTGIASKFDSIEKSDIDKEFEAEIDFEKEGQVEKEQEIEQENKKKSLKNTQGFSM
ncbi:hypothetical protein BDK63_001274 [Halomonas campaniensis]|uniref:Mobilization protein n=1 Tax=Halomonas campaniensis TaxID=213554 RepID=A0A7W5K202_9GAMM|nr:hypothetical protein [Halomonas campaniensis]MBB3330408.1 hypothetical protein [Halomonas campaniensis]